MCPTCVCIYMYIYACTLVLCTHERASTPIPLGVTTTYIPPHTCGRMYGLWLTSMDHCRDRRMIYYCMTYTHIVTPPIV